MPRFTIVRIRGGKGAVWLEAASTVVRSGKNIPNERGGVDEVGDNPLIWNLWKFCPTIDSVVPVVL